MPKTPFKLETIAYSLRLPVTWAAWVTAQAQRTGNANQALREIIEDAKTFYGLPDVLTEQLDAEAAKLGKSRREYIIHLLSLRAAELLKSAPAANSSSTKKR
jgi:predicted DNA-binding protein